MSRKLDLLADEMVKLTDHADLSRETLRLAEKALKPWQKDMCCILKVDGAYVACMENVVDRYAEDLDLQYAVVCFHKSLTKLIGQAREPIPTVPARPERCNCEYRRNDTANLFVFLDAHRPWRRMKVTEHRAANDFALYLRDLVDVHYLDAEMIAVLLHSLSKHSAVALYETFPAHRMLQRLEFH